MALTREDKAFIVDTIAQAFVAYDARSAARKPASTAAKAPVKENTFVRDVIARRKSIACTAPQACGKLFGSPERAANHWHAA